MTGSGWARPGWVSVCSFFDGLSEGKNRATNDLSNAAPQTSLGAGNFSANDEKSGPRENLKSLGVKNRKALSPVRAGECESRGLFPVQRSADPPSLSCSEDSPDPTAHLPTPSRPLPAGLPRAILTLCAFRRERGPRTCWQEGGRRREQEREIKNGGGQEVSIFSVQHRNLVKLLNSCIEKGRRLLVVEHLENYYVNRTLFGNPPPSPFLPSFSSFSSVLLFSFSGTEERRVGGSVAIDAGKGGEGWSWSGRGGPSFVSARGLRYLHEESWLTIIKRDVGPINMLLAKLFDEHHRGMLGKWTPLLIHLAPTALSLSLSHTHIAYN